VKRKFKVLAATVALTLLFGPALCLVIAEAIWDTASR